MVSLSSVIQGLMAAGTGSRFMGEGLGSGSAWALLEGCSSL